MRNIPKKIPSSASPETIAAEIKRLAGLSVTGLREAWAKEFRRDPPKGLWPDFLLRSLAWRLQERAFGGHDKATLKLLEAYGHERQGDSRCQRLKTGTVLIREYGGTRHTVTIVPEGFVWQEKTYSSLTTISRLITLPALIGAVPGSLASGKGRREQHQKAETGQREAQNCPLCHLHPQIHGT